MLDRRNTGAHRQLYSIEVPIDVGNVDSQPNKDYGHAQSALFVGIQESAMRIRFPHLRFSLLLLFSFVLLAASTGFAQEVEKDKAQKQTEKRAQLERKTLGMLDELATQAVSLKLPENRSFVLAAAADLLWTHDEKRARNLFWDALNNLISTNNPTVETPKDSAQRDATAKDSTAKRSASDRARELSQYHAIFATREEFLRRVAQRDPQLALDMLRATRLPVPDNPDANYSLPDERDLEQEIANQTAARDPKQALQLARESLAKGLTYQSYGVLLRLNQNNPEAAVEFADDLIGKIQTANVAPDTIAVGMALMLLRAARPAPTSAENTAVLGPGRIKLSDDQRRTLVEILADAADNASANSNLMAGIADAMPDIEQLAPGRADKLKAKLAARVLTKEQREWGQLDSLFSKGTAEDLVRAGAAANDDARGGFYQAAAAKAVMNGKADALREFIKSEVKDESQRSSLNDLLDAHQMNLFLSRGDVDEVQKLLPSIRLKEKRAVAMAEVAMMLEKKGKHDEALGLLDEAHALVKLDLTSQAQSEALLAVLLADAIVDPDRAFTAIEPIVDRANDNLTKLLLLDKLIKSGFVKDGEIKLRNPGIFSLDFVVFKYGKGVVALANADFNRTKALTDRLQRNELRVMARLLMVQALLGRGEQTATVGQR
ncbi:MAG: hypothetical protein QOH70_516 [Blastocatellia bacterium]|jgi:hypothetical protein|nr:hypothetical protein [Blastocatellia bacterium]